MGSHRERTDPRVRPSYDRFPTCRHSAYIRYQPLPGSETRRTGARNSLSARRTIGFQPVATQRTSNTNRYLDPKPTSRERVRDHSPVSPTHHRQWNPVGQPGPTVPVGPIRGQALAQTQFTRAAPFPPRGKGLHCWTPPAHTGRLIRISRNTRLDNTS
jgi:hypothetical protein